MNLIQGLYSVNDFLDQGGVAMYLIFMIAVALWMMIIERFLYIRFFSRKQQAELIMEWQTLQHHSDATNIRGAFKSMMRQQLYTRLDIVKMLVTLAPLFGLYGTVYGMIEIFDVIAQSGTSDARAIAAGISMATLTTLAGMAVAIMGLFFQHRLESLARRTTLEFNKRLKIHAKNPT